MVDKKAFRTLTSGLYIVTAHGADGCDVGCVINTLEQVASEPPQLAMSLNKENATTAVVRASGRFAATVLSQDATMELIGRFGFKSSAEVDKFDGLDFSVCGGDVPYVPDSALARFLVDVQHEVDLGSHILFVGTVTEAEVLDDGEPMTYAYYHGTLRGKTPPKAATYNGGEGDGAPAAQPVAPAAAAEEVAEALAEAIEQPRYAWQCTLCGYIEEGYPDGLPDDYACPICGAGPEMFERIEL